MNVVVSFPLLKNDQVQVEDLGLVQDLIMGLNFRDPLVVDHVQGPFQAWDPALTGVLLLGVVPWDQNLLLQDLVGMPLPGVMDLAVEQAYVAQPCLV